ncbi:MAG: hypothetical protein O4803_06080, partial [Trichodesmium sp. St15_bin1_1]|nr:hypothetical protein [Trichodesmium sp. St15_bin1_1]
ICGKNHSAFSGTGKREQIVGKSFNRFIYFFICRNLWADCCRYFANNSLYQYYSVGVIFRY